MISGTKAVFCNFKKMKGFFLFLCLVMGYTAGAQLERATLQVSGLTCALCAKTVQKALEKLPFIKEVKPDLNTQQYALTFRSDRPIVLEQIKQEVEDAGFSVAQLQLIASFDNLDLDAQSQVKIGAICFQFINATNRQVKGEQTFTLLEKDFLSGKVFSKYCKDRRANCGNRTSLASGERVYKVILS